MNEENTVDNIDVQDLHAATITEISVEEIEARENAASQAVYCCIANFAF